LSTNKKRKRLSGAGRKPKGRFVGNTERLNIRCTPIIKDRLEMAARKNEHSLPQEIQERLQRTFDDDAYADHYDPAMSGLLWIMEFAALQYRGEGTKNLPAWRTDAAEFEGFKAAIINILERLRPVGDATELLARSAGEPNSPLARAKHVEWQIFDVVPLAARPEQLISYERKGRLGKLPDFPLGSPTQRSYQEFFEREEGRSAALKALGK
jgi:hypothetical protein